MEARAGAHCGGQCATPKGEALFRQREEDQLAIYQLYVPDQPQIIKIHDHHVEIQWSNITQPNLLGYKLKHRQPRGSHASLNTSGVSTAPTYTESTVYARPKPLYTESTLYARPEDHESFLVDISKPGEHQLSLCSVFHGGYSSLYSTPLTYDVPALPPPPTALLQDPERTSHDSMVLTWDRAGFTHTTITNDIIQYKLASTGVWMAKTGDWSQEHVAEHSSFILKDLEVGEVYDVRVCSVYGYLGGTRSDFTTITGYTRPTSPPHGLGYSTTDKQHRKRCGVKWQAPAHIGIHVLHYVVENHDTSVHVIETKNVPSEEEDPGVYEVKITDCKQVQVKAVCGTGEPEVRYHSQWCKVY